MTDGEICGACKVLPVIFFFGPRRGRKDKIIQRTKKLSPHPNILTSLNTTFEWCFKLHVSFPEYTEPKVGNRAWCSGIR